MSKNIRWFFIIALTWTWTFWIPIALHTYGYLESVPNWFFIIGGLGPLISATVVSLISGGASELKRLVSRLFVWRVKPWFYLFVILFPIFCHSIILGLGFLVGNLSSFPVFDIAPTIIIIWIGLSLFMLVEEAGWRGFALPKLLEETSAMKASVIIGLVWGLWHAPIIVGVPTMFGLATEVPGLVACVIYTINTIALSILFTWLFKNTAGSLLIATLFHGALNTVPRLYETSAVLTESAKRYDAIFYWVLLTIIFAISYLIIRKK